MKKRVLVTAYFAKNVGDDLFLKVLFDRYPHVNWELLTANRDYLKIFKTYNNVKITYSYRDIKINKYHFNPFFLINKLLQGAKKYDAIVHIGGSIFMQSPAWRMKLAERDYLIRKFKAKRNFILGANFGPFKDRFFIKKYRDLFMEYDDVCFRDSLSYQLFKGLENVRYAPDVVLNLNDRQTKSPRKVIGLSTIHLENRAGLKKYSERYNHKIAQLIEGYIEEGYQIRLFSFCETEGDLQGIKDIKRAVDPKYLKSIKVINYQGDLDAFLKDFKACERIIGTRFHALILAMIYDQPFYPLIYSQKSSNFLADLGFQNLGCQIKDIEHLTMNDIRTLENFNHLTDKQVFLEASKQFAKLDEFIGERGEENEQTKDVVCN